MRVLLLRLCSGCTAYVLGFTVQGLEFKGKSRFTCVGLKVPQGTSPEEKPIVHNDLWRLLCGLKGGAGCKKACTRISIVQSPDPLL